MKKKIIICLALILIVAIAGVCMILFFNKENTFLRNFNRALKNEDHMQKFVEKNIDFNLACAYDKAMRYTEYPYDGKVIMEQAEKLKDTLTKEEIEKYKSEKMEQYKDFCSKEYSKFKTISKESESEEKPGLTCRKLEKETSSKTEVFVFYYYNDSLVDIKYDVISYGFGIIEKDMRKSKIESYFGGEIKGSELKSLIDTIISMNLADAGDRGKFVGINVKENSITNYRGYKDLYDACQKANIYDFDDGTIIEESDNSEENVTEATREMAKLKTKINSQKKYNVKAFAYEGNIVWIYIDVPDEYK